MADALATECEFLRKVLLNHERSMRSMIDAIHGAADGPAANPATRTEMLAHADLALRAIEDARMRLGKVIQYGHDGVSVYDREPRKWGREHDTTSGT